MNVIQKTPGPVLDFEISKTKISLADDELTLNLAKYERDDPVHIDICVSKLGMLVTGVIPGVADKYVAEIDIPARRYTETVTLTENEDEENVTERVPVPFNMGECTLYLWGLED